MTCHLFISDKRPVFHQLSWLTLNGEFGQTYPVLRNTCGDKSPLTEGSRGGRKVTSRETRCGSESKCPHVLPKMDSKSLLLPRPQPQGRRSRGGKRVPEALIMKLPSQEGNVRSEEEVSRLIPFPSICLWASPMPVTSFFPTGSAPPGGTPTPGLLLLLSFFCRFLLCPGNSLLTWRSAHCSAQTGPSLWTCWESGRV